MDPQTVLAVQYTQRLLAGCPVKEPDPALYNGFGPSLLILWETAQRDGPAAARRSYNAMRRADPALALLDQTEVEIYPGDLGLDEAAFKRLTEYEYTDAGQGEAFSYLFADRLRFVPGMGWYIWNKKRWQHDDREAVVQYAILAARARRSALRQQKPPDGGDSDDVKDQLAAREAALKWTLGAENLTKIKNTIGVGKTVPDMITPASEFDRDDHLLGVANGIVDLRSGQLLEPDPARRITMSSDVPYFPEATAKRWEQFILEICDRDTTLAAYLQRAIGYSLTGDISEQCFFLCYGTGANGKSTLLNILKALAGEYSANTPFSTFEAGKQSGTGQEIVSLRGRRVVLSSETNDGTRLNEARIKAITGGDDITGRFLYQPSTITFKPSFKIWLAANHKPTITGGDEGIWRRVRLIPFLVSFAKIQRDKHLEAKLMSELPGILAWAVRGAMAWYQQGLGEPLAVENATAAYREESDILGQFLVEHVLTGEHMEAKSSDLYAQYAEWADSNGLYKQSHVKFARAMQERGFEKARRNNGVMWLGLGLRCDERLYANQSDFLGETL